MYYYVILSWTGTSPSGMAVIEVGLPSGYSTSDSSPLVVPVRRVDQNNDNVVFYLDSVSDRCSLPSERTCRIILKSQFLDIFLKCYKESVDIFSLSIVI